VLDYSVHGDTRVWIRSREWAKPMTIRAAHELPEGEYETIAVDPGTLQLGWRKVAHRARHWVGHKRCFEIRLERGQTVCISEDHSLFTLDSDTVEPVAVRGEDVVPGMPLVVPYDLSSGTGAWSTDLATLDLSGLPDACAPRYQ